MKADTILDYALFQLDASRSRCELWISARNATEKLATGVFKPFLSHLEEAQQQIAAGATSVKLSPSRDSNKGSVTEFRWFSKGTMERFVRFVSTPEVLEHAILVEAEKNRIEEVFCTRALNTESEESESEVVSARSATTGLSEVHACNEIILQQSGETVKEVLFGDSCNNEDGELGPLVKFMNSHRRMLQKAQYTIFRQAASAGFDMVHLPDLLLFADCFGAVRLRRACLEFISLLEKCRNVCSSEPDFEVAIQSALSLAAVESPQYLDYMQEEYVQLNSCKTISNYMGKPNQIPENGCWGESSRVSLFKNPFMSYGLFKATPLKAMDPPNRPLSYLTSYHAHWKDSDECAYPSKSSATCIKNMMRKPNLGFCTATKSDCHLDLKDNELHSNATFANGNLLFSMGDAVKCGNQETVEPVSVRLLDASIEEADSRSSVCKLLPYDSIIGHPFATKHSFEHGHIMAKTQLQSFNVIQFDKEIIESKKFMQNCSSSERKFSSQMCRLVHRSSSIRQSDLVFHQTDNLSNWGKQSSLEINHRKTEEDFKCFSSTRHNDLGEDRKDKSLSQFEISSYASDRELNPSLFSETPCASVDEENCYILNCDISSASECGQAFEPLAANLEGLRENKVKSINSQPDRPIGTTALNPQGNLITEDSVVGIENHAGLDPVGLRSVPCQCMLSDISSGRVFSNTHSSNKPSQDEGRPYEHYCEHREAKLELESPLKKAESGARLEALQGVLEKGENDKASRSMCLVEKEFVTTEEESGAPRLQDRKIEAAEDILGELPYYGQTSPASYEIHPSVATSQAAESETSTSNVVSARNILPHSHKSLFKATSRRKSQSLILCSSKRAMKCSNRRETLPECQRSISAGASKIDDKTVFTSTSASSKQTKKERNTPYSVLQDQVSQPEKHNIPKCPKSKLCVSRSQRERFSAVSFLESDFSQLPLSFDQSPASEEYKVHEVSPARDKMTAVIRPKDMRSSVQRIHNVGPLKMKNARCQTKTQVKPYKLGLALAVSKNAKPFLRKGRGIGPGAGPTVLKLKSTMTSDNRKIHNEEMLQLSDLMFNGEDVTVCNVENQTDFQSMEDVEQMDNCQGSSEAVERETCFTDASPERGISSYTHNQQLPSQPPKILEDLQDNMTDLKKPPDNSIRSDDMLSNSSFSPAASECVLSPSSPKSTLEKRFSVADDSAIPALSPSRSMFKLEDRDEKASTNSPATPVRLSCGMLCYKPSAAFESAFLGSSRAHRNSGAYDNVPAGQCIKQSQQFSKRLKSFLSLGRQNTSARYRITEPLSTSALSGVETEAGAVEGDLVSGSAENVESKCKHGRSRLDMTLEAPVKAIVAAESGRWPFFSLLACRGRGADP